MIRQPIGEIVTRHATLLGSLSRRSIVTCKPELHGTRATSASIQELRHQHHRVGGSVATGVLRRHDPLFGSISRRSIAACKLELHGARRPFPYAVALRWHGGPAVSDDAPTITLTFLQPDDTTRQVPARIGETLLQTAHRNDIDLEGACEGVCACSTCHLILPPALYDTLPQPSEDEEDMLDMAFGLSETSRLGCQVTVTSDMDGAVLEMPKATRNFYVDGHVPKPH